MKCKDCGGEMKALFTSSYCPNCDDKADPLRVVPPTPGLASRYYVWSAGHRYRKELNHDGTSDFILDDPKP